MQNWINNISNNGMPLIVKSIHIGDFVEVVYNDGQEVFYGGYVTTITSDAPSGETEKVYVLGLSTQHPDHNTEEKIIWTTHIKKFRILHKGIEHHQGLQEPAGFNQVNSRN